LTENWIGSYLLKRCLKIILYLVLRSSDSLAAVRVGCCPSVCHNAVAMASKQSNSRDVVQSPSFRLAGTPLLCDSGPSG